MLAVVLTPYQSPQVLKGPYVDLAALFKDCRRYICPVGAEICEWFDERWVPVDIVKVA